MNAADFLPQDTAADDRAQVLVIDDEVRSQEAMRGTLDEDFRILTASDTAEARGLLERHAVAVILCDQRIPGVTGVQFLREARERWPEAVRMTDLARRHGVTVLTRVMARVVELLRLPLLMEGWLQALVGMPVQPGGTTPVAVQQVVRSFDPCMVCTVH